MQGKNSGTDIGKGVKIRKALLLQSFFAVLLFRSIHRVSVNHKAAVEIFRNKINCHCACFNQVFVKSYKERAAELGYTVDEILTLASIIEKEAANQSEFGDVSSVFHNRLNDPANFPRLESDATVVYSIQHETGVRPNLTGEALERDDPYNSYKVTGLVPGPIANPSNSAILATLNPKNTQFYYFVSNGQKTYFAKTLQEHNANKAMYLKGASDANS